MTRVSTKQLQNAAGVSASTIQRWVREGLLLPGTRANTGRGAGTQAWFPVENLDLIQEIQLRRLNGATLDEVRRELEALGKISRPKKKK